MTQQHDDVGRSGIYPPTGPRPDNAEAITPGDINEEQTGHHDRPGVARDEELKGAARLPRKGDEADDELGSGEDD